MITNVEAVNLVETSPSLREAQKKLLCGDNALEKTQTGFRSMSKYINIPIFWIDDIRLMPPGSSPLYPFD